MYLFPLVFNLSFSLYFGFFILFLLLFFVYFFCMCIFLSSFICILFMFICIYLIFLYKLTLWNDKFTSLALNIVDGLRVSWSELLCVSYILLCVVCMCVYMRISDVGMCKLFSVYLTALKWVCGNRNRSITFIHRLFGAESEYFYSIFIILL